MKNNSFDKGIVDLATVASGVYLLEVRNNNGATKKVRIVKE